MPTNAPDIRINSPFWARFMSLFVGGRLVTPATGSQMAGVSSYGSVGDSIVTDERNLQLATVFACIRLITTMVGGLPLDGYRRTTDGLVKDNTISIARLLRNSPNPYMNGLEFREAMTMNLTAYGNAYALVERNVVGDVISLLPLLSANMDVRLDEQTGKKVIYRYSRAGKYADFSPDEIFHIKGFGFNGLVGVSPLAFSAKAAGVAIAMEDNQRDFFANGAKSPRILSTGDKILDREQRAQLRENFEEIAGGPVRKRLWILEGGFTSEQIGVDPNDAQMLESRKFSVAELARFYGVPPFMVGETEKSTSWGTGLEQQNLAFTQQTLKPYLDRWEAAIQAQLIRPQDRDKYLMEHNLNGLLRGDSAARASYYGNMKQNGIMTINEIRRLENLPPIAGGDVAMQQSQNVPITQVNTGGSSNASN